MGTWGAGLYENDTALDVKGEFEEYYQRGMAVQEITDRLMQEYADILEDADEAPLFWFALADTQYHFGVLLPLVRESALTWLQMVRARLENEPVCDTDKARIMLDRLQKELHAPLPPEKKAKKKRLYTCQWKLEDVFAYQLESDMAKEMGLAGRYFLIQKVDECMWYPGHIVPIVSVKLTSGPTLPATLEEYDLLEFVQTGFTKYEDRFLPIDMRRPREDITEKAKLHYKVDAYGYLPEYRITLLNTSKRVIPKKLIYLGNYENAQRPQLEFIPHAKENLQVVAWKQFGETFETKMLQRYRWHNLRELTIYHADGNQK